MKTPTPNKIRTAKGTLRALVWEYGRLPREKRELFEFL